MSSRKLFNYIDVGAVANRLSDNCVKIIDVRTVHEFSEAHIPIAVNIPSTEWENMDMVDKLIQDHSSFQNLSLIFHCAYSQQRGPTCASIYAERKRELEDTKPHDMYYRIISIS